MQKVPTHLDHLVYAATNLEGGMREIQRQLGVRPVPGGHHPEFGTCNALVAIGKSTYLEVIAPDPALPRPERGWPFGLDTVSRSRIVTWALREESIESQAIRAKEAGLDLGDVRSGSRRRPDGSTRSWKLTDPWAMPKDGAVPFLIAWGATRHPATDAPMAGELVAFRITHPDPSAVRAALEWIGVDMGVEKATRMQLIATIETGSGLVEMR